MTTDVTVSKTTVGTMTVLRTESIKVVNESSVKIVVEVPMSITVKISVVNENWVMSIVVVSKS